MTTTLPVHSITGLRALGWRKPRRGETEPRPIWPMLGGAPEDDSDDGSSDDDSDSSDSDDGATEGETDDGSTGDDDGDGLGDKGKRALDEMKQKWRTEKQRRQQVEAKLAQAGNDSGDKTDPDTIRQEAEQQANSKANARIVRSEIRAAATGKLADPKDALTFLDTSTFEVDENGDVDSDEIADAIEDLVKNKPYLAAQGGKRFQGTGDGGAARKAGKPKQLNEGDLKTMTPDQIVKAQNEGQLNDLLGAG